MLRISRARYCITGQARVDLGRMAAEGVRETLVTLGNLLEREVFIEAKYPTLGNMKK